MDNISLVIRGSAVVCSEALHAVSSFGKRDVDRGSDQGLVVGHHVKHSDRVVVGAALMGFYFQNKRN